MNSFCIAKHEIKRVNYVSIIDIVSYQEREEEDMMVAEEEAVAAAGAGIPEEAGGGGSRESGGVQSERRAQPGKDGGVAVLPLHQCVRVIEKQRVLFCVCMNYVLYSVISLLRDSGESAFVTMRIFRTKTFPRPVENNVENRR